MTMTMTPTSGAATMTPASGRRRKGSFGNSQDLLSQQAGYESEGLQEGSSPAPSATAANILHYATVRGSRRGKNRESRRIFGRDNIFSGLYSDSPTGKDHSRVAHLPPASGSESGRRSHPRSPALRAGTIPRTPEHSLPEPPRTPPIVPRFGEWREAENTEDGADNQEALQSAVTPGKSGRNDKDPAGMIGLTLGNSSYPNYALYFRAAHARRLRATGRLGPNASTEEEERHLSEFSGPLEAPPPFSFTSTLNGYDEEADNGGPEEGEGSLKEELFPWMEGEKILLEEEEDDEDEFGFRNALKNAKRRSLDDPRASAPNGTHGSGPLRPSYALDEEVGDPAASQGKGGGDAGQGKWWWSGQFPQTNAEDEGKGGDAEEEEEHRVSTDKERLLHAQPQQQQPLLKRPWGVWREWRELAGAGGGGSNSSSTTTSTTSSNMGSNGNATGGGTSMSSSRTCSRNLSTSSSSACSAGSSSVANSSSCSTHSPQQWGMQWGKGQSAADAEECASDGSTSHPKIDLPNGEPNAGPTERQGFRYWLKQHLLRVRISMGRPPHFAPATASVVPQSTP